MQWVVGGVISELLRSDADTLFICMGKNSAPLFAFTFIQFYFPIIPHIENQLEVNYDGISHGGFSAIGLLYFFSFSLSNTKHIPESPIVRHVQQHYNTS